MCFIYQCLVFKCWSSTIKYEDRFDLVVEQLAYAREEKREVGRLQGMAFSISSPVYRLVEPHTHV